MVPPHGRHDDEPIDAMIDRSSLGTDGARLLRKRTSRQDAVLARQIGELRERAQGGDAAAAFKLAESLVHVGDLVGADGWYREAVRIGLLRMADLAEDRGDEAAATQWRARAATLGSVPKRR